MASAPASQTRLQEAIQFHQRGYLARAQAICEAILQTDSNHVACLNLLAVIASQSQDHERAVELFSKALEIQPKNAALYSNRGRALQRLKRLDAALANYDRAIAIKPDLAEAHLNRGNALQELKQIDAALASYDRAIAIAPSYAEAYSNRGNVLKEIKQPDAALADYDRAIAIKPDYAEAYSNRGSLLVDLKRLDAALASCERAIAINPSLAEAYSNRGNVLRELNQPDAALANCDRAIAIKPDLAEAHANRGHVLQQLKQLEAALASYDRAIAIKPDLAEVHANRGHVLRQLKQLEAALASYDRAIAIKPDLAEAYWNKALVLLSIGNFREGWALYDWRWQSESASARLAKLPRRFADDWDGQPLRGRLLVLPEQGIGDQIFYSGMLNDLRSRAESITVCIDQRLVGLYQRSFPGLNVVPVQAALDTGEHFDAQVYMAGLGRFCRHSVTAFENIKVPYLRACPDRARKLRSEIAEEGKLICGLSWVSKNTDFGRDKSLGLHDLASVFELPGIEFVDLQYGDTSKEQAALYDSLGIELRSVSQIDNFHDLDGLAALIDACDVILTVSNTTAHLAAAMGKRAIIMLPFSSGLLWYWHVDRDESVWYPSVRLFRQRRMGEWGGVVQRVRAALSQEQGERALAV